MNQQYRGAQGCKAGVQAGPGVPISLLLSSQTKDPVPTATLHDRVKSLVADMSISVDRLRGIANRAGIACPDTPECDRSGETLSASIVSLERVSASLYDVVGQLEQVA